MNAAYALAATLTGGVGFFVDGSWDGAMACLTASLVGAVIAGFGTLAAGDGQQLSKAPSVPRVIVPRWPRGWRAWAALGSSALVTFLFAGMLVVTLSAPVHVLSSTPGGSYRASRRRSVILLLSWALVGGGMLAGLILACGGPLLVAVAGLALMTGAGLATLFTPGFFAVKLAELVFRPGPQSRLQVHRLLEDGLTRQVLRQENAACQFRSPELASYLAASHLAALTAQTCARARHEQRKAATVAARTGPAARLLAKLTPPFTARLAADVAWGITALAFVDMLAFPVPGGLAAWIPWVALALAAALTRSDRLPPWALRRMPKWRLPSTSEIKRKLGALATPRGRLLSQAGAVAFAVVIAVLGAVARPVLQYLWPAVVLLLSSLLFLCARAAARRAASGLVRVFRWSLATDPWPAWKRIALLAATGGVIVLTAGLAGPASLWDGVAATLVWLLPAALTLAVGGWLTLLARRKTRTSTRRRLAYAVDVLIALVTGCTVLLLVNPRLLGALPAAGLLFPPAAWLAFRGWRAMSGSRRVTIKAAADIVFSLAAGADIVLALAWAASLLDMPAWEVALVRRLGQQAGAVDDLPWWLWGGLYLLLAAATVALIRWPEHLRRLRKPLIASPLVPAVDAVRRVLTGAHIALLVAVLVGLTAPAAVRPVLRGQLSDRYTVTLLDNLGARGEIAAYQVVQRWLRSAPRRQLSPLASLVTDVQQTAEPGAGPGDASSTELDLARRLGRIQATALALDPTRPLSEGEGDAASLSEQASRVQSAEHEETNVGKELHQAAELAVAALSNVLGIPRLTDNGAYQVLQEYLGSLIESSPLKDVFAEWAGRVAGAIRPPAAAPMVVPDPGNLERASAADLAAQRSRTPVADPAAASRDISRMEADDPIAAAVKLANQARYLQQDAGPCAGCAQPQPADDQGHTGNQDDQPEHPYIPEIP